MSLTGFPSRKRSSSQALSSVCKIPRASSRATSPSVKDDGSNPIENYYYAREDCSSSLHSPLPSSPPMPPSPYYGESPSDYYDGVLPSDYSEPSPSRLPRNPSGRRFNYGNGSSFEHCPELSIPTDELAQFLSSEGAMQYNRFELETEIRRADPKRVQENQTLNRYYRSDKDLWEDVDIESLREYDPHIRPIRKAVNDYFALEAKPWQLAVMNDLLHNRRDVVVSAGTSQGKSLTFQALPILGPKAGIVLVICPTLSLMDDQVGFLY